MRCKRFIAGLSRHAYDALIQMPSTNKQYDMNNATEFIQLLKDSISALNVELEKKPEKAKR